MDINGKADPYLVLSLESKTSSDLDNYVPNQLNPFAQKVGIASGGILWRHGIC